jgi:hypothetical protein
MHVKAKRTRETFKLLALEHILGGDLNLLQLIQNVELGQVERSVSVDHVGILHDDQIEPTASSSSTSRGAVFSSDFLEVNSDVLSQRAFQYSNLPAASVSLTFNCSVGKGPPPTRVV